MGQGDNTSEIKNEIHTIENDKRSDTDVRRRRNVLEMIVETAPSMIIGINPVGKITMFNSHAEVVTEYDKGETIGKSFIELFL